MAEFKPNLIVYIAGTDILVGDPLGKLDISADGIKSRDELVFKTAKDRQIPIVLLIRFVFFLTIGIVIFIYLLSLYSGGYQHSNAAIIANSIINFYDKLLVNGIKSSL